MSHKGYPFVVVRSGRTFLSRRDAGFTLIELLIVIGILAILSTVVILVINPVQLINNARSDGARYEIKELAELIIKVKGLTGRASSAITGSGCSDCVCRVATPAAEIAGCVTAWQSVVNNFQTAAQDLGLGQSWANFMADPWGSPYLYDENDTDGCGRDTLASPGPDKTYGGGDDIYPMDNSSYIPNLTGACL